MMNGFLAVSILLQAFLNCVECSKLTRGHFFQRINDNNDDANKKDDSKEIFLREDFFNCDRETACSSVARGSSSSHQVLKSYKDLSAVKENWKKIHLVSLGKLHLINLSFSRINSAMTDYLRCYWCATLWHNLDDTNESKDNIKRGCWDFVDGDVRARSLGSLQWSRPPLFWGWWWPRPFIAAKSNF